MAFVPLIRDYLDVLSTLTHSSSGTPEIFGILKATVAFFCQAGLSFGAYCLTFGWVRDIFYLPLLVPKYAQAIFSEHFFLEDIHLASSQLDSLTQGPSPLTLFGYGLLNSVFCCLPFSTVHFISIRRLLVQGIYAGSANILGTVLGQSLFVLLTLFGCRTIIISWFSLEPFNYLFGLGLVFWVLYTMATEKRLRAVDLSETQTLLFIFGTSFLLTWTEQGTLYQSLTQLNFGPAPSLLQFDLGSQGQLFGHFSYGFGLLLGQALVSCLFIWSTLTLKKIVFQLSNLPYSVFLKRLNFIFLTGTFSLSLSSLPYYGYDYLLTGPLGFISQDKSLETSLFSQKNLKDSNRLLTGLDVTFPLTIDTDISYFDRADYGDQPGYFKRNFEALNYQGEYAWLCRRDKKPNLYASGKPAKTVIRDLLETVNLEKSDEGGDTQETDKTPKATKRLAQTTAFDTQKTPSKFRQKLKKRFTDTYMEKRLDYRTSSGYAIGESFNTLQSLTDPPVSSQSQIETAVKQKYYANPVYQTLLKVDIDTFLKRQPQTAFLSEEDEALLFQKRYLLSKYHDTLRDYQKVPYAPEFQELFQGSKSFVDRVYNHQFKGTLTVLRRLFAVTLDKEYNLPQKAVLKFDQPLFQKDPLAADVTRHEELPQQNGLKSPFLELTDASPFYLGWDNELRQMIFTKRFLPPTQNVKMEVPNDLNPRTFYANLKRDPALTEGSTQPSETLVFTAWPLPKDRIYELKANPTNQLVTLFEPVTNPQMKFLSEAVTMNFNSSKDDIYTFPANMRYFGRVAERLAPNQGGFIWPGSGETQLGK